VQAWRSRLSLSSDAAANLLLAVAALFVAGCAITLWLAPYPTTIENWQIVVAAAGWAGAWVGSTILLRSRLGRHDRLLLATTAMLTGWGLMMQARLAPARLTRQVVWLILGCGAMCAVALTRGLLRALRRYRYSLLIAGLALLGTTLVFGVNPAGYGQRLWLGAFGLYLQPSEPLKLLLVVYLAAYLSSKRDLSEPAKGRRSLWLAVLGPMAAMVGLALVLLGWQQDLGAALLYYLIFVMMLYLAWGNTWLVLVSLLLFVPVGIAGTILSDRVALRVSIWLAPWDPAQADRAFQILQSLFAFGAGGLFGQGLGQGAPGLIPAVHTDFVYAALVEEFGLVGAIGFVGLVACYAYRGIRLAQKSKSTFEALLAGGVAALVVLQTWVIAGGNARLIPITGVTLPFLSHGGSSLVTMLMATGLLLNVSAPHPVTINLSLSPDANRPLRETAARLSQGLLVLLLALSVITGILAIQRSAVLQTYPTNPRFRLAEERVRRGRILDRDQAVLADISTDELGYVTRTYPVPEAAPVVGYATFEYGADGVEAACDARLRGTYDDTPWESVRDRLLHTDPVGQGVRLTVDAALQALAQGKLEGLTGAVVIIDARTGEILALASSPIYDPANVVDEWVTLSAAENSPFLNRATQALAQPGTSLQPLILAAAWAADDSLTPAEPIESPVALNGMTIACTTPPEQRNWQSVLAAGCPYPFVAAAGDLGNAAFTDALARFGLLEAPSLTVPTIAGDLPTGQLEVGADAIGQGALLVTPLQMVRAFAVLGNEGKLPTLQLLQQQQEGCTTAPAAAEEVSVVEPAVAAELRATLTNFGGVVGHTGASYAGVDRRQSWFLGLNSATVPRFAAVVLVDEAETADQAVAIGVELLERSTAP
jgi:cell division protein FtsW (lipid II flippase)/cell division protein FtsI/penicillin-binding protein 2